MAHINSAHFFVHAPIFVEEPLDPNPETVDHVPII